MQAATQRQSQEAAAEPLGVPYGSDGDHLRAGVAKIVEIPVAIGAALLAITPRDAR